MASSLDDAWKRRTEMLFERLTVRWEIAGLPLTEQAMLLGRYRMADTETQRWVRETIALHVERYIPSCRQRAGRVRRVKFRRLGDSDIEVSEISLGSWLTYGGGVEQEHTEACTRAAFDAGINFFDTANVYGGGAAESVWGEVLKDFDRGSYVLATKVFFPMSETDRRPLARADPQADRCVARAPADRLRRPLPVPPPRSRDADRGDDGGAHRGLRSRQGA